MSCVIGLVHKKNVYLAADGVATTDELELRPIDSIKIFRKGPFILGYAGSVRTGQIINYGDYDLPETIWGWADIIREQITEKGAMITSDGQTEMQGANFIIGYKKKLYEVLSDFQVNPVNSIGYTAIGSGSGFAVGSLFTSADGDFTPEQRLYLALEAAAQFSGACGPPYKIEVLNGN